VNGTTGMTRLITYWTRRQDLDASAGKKAELRLAMIERAGVAEFVSIEIYEVPAGPA
jgi:hypothetical protein